MLAACALALVASAQADHQPGTKNNGLSICEEQYLQSWNQVLDEKVGPYNGAAGRNIVEDGVQTKKNGVRAATEAECRDGLAVMDRMLNPAPVVEYSEPPAAPTTSSYSGGGYAIPDYIVQCESGGDYSAQNPSGAYGAYQIMPGTAAAYGCDLSTPAGQDSCAAEIYATEGSSPWVCG